jgi:hypothetical protein
MDTLETFLGLVILLFIFTMMLGFYFLPTLIAMSNHHINLVGIFLLNFFAGWTGMGWLGALIWSVIV